MDTVKLIDKNRISFTEMCRKIVVMLVVLFILSAIGKKNADAQEAYAEFNGGTLVFFYDYHKSSLSYDLNSGNDIPSWNVIADRITKVVFDDSFKDYKPLSCASWFYGCYNLNEISCLRENLNTSDVTNMCYMFAQCNQLENLDLSGFNTANVINMDCMFWGCSKLARLDVSSFDTKNVTSMCMMFDNCLGLSQLDLSHFDTANVLEMGHMFYLCGVSMLDISSFDTNNVTNMFEMFAECDSLRTIYVGDKWNTANVIYSENMFYGCLSLFGGHGSTVYDYELTDKTFARMDGGEQSPGYFTKLGQQPYDPEAYAYAIFDNGILTFYYKKVIPEHGAYSWANFVTNHFQNYVDDYYSYYDFRSSVKKVIFDNSFKKFHPKSLKGLFCGFCYMTEIEGLRENLNTENATNLSGMFAHCDNLVNLDLSGFDTKNVMNLDSMFLSCCSLTNLDLSIFDTKNVTNMSRMFDYCYNLTNIDLSNLKTENVSDMSRMFADCKNLISLNLSSFNTKNVIDMHEMFSFCLTLTTISVSDNWTTEKCSNSSDMFDMCSSLRGGKGTFHSFSNVDKSFAHIDGGFDNPGYLTKNIISFIVSKPPNKTEYIVGESIESIGGELLITYYDNSTEFVSLENAILSDYQCNTIGEQIIKVSYMNLETTFTVTVNPSNNLNTPISPVSNNIETNVWASHHTIYINAPTDTKYKIIDTNGRIITTSTTKSTHNEIIINTSGLLLVIINGTTYKVII
ncbi:MAG: BspA family leucine-rich repeat surface protein [Bacteroidales bacterium]|nr:BspA family leucine-rich repeat surface protein [Bacteroidales bacterium]